MITKPSEALELVRERLTGPKGVDLYICNELDLLSRRGAVGWTTAEEVKGFIQGGLLDGIDTSGHWPSSLGSWVGIYLGRTEGMARPDFRRLVHEVRIEWLDSMTRMYQRQGR